MKHETNVRLQENVAVENHSLRACCVRRRMFAGRGLATPFKTTRCGLGWRSNHSLKNGAKSMSTLVRFFVPLSPFAERPRTPNTIVMLTLYEYAVKISPSLPEREKQMSLPIGGG